MKEISKYDEEILEPYREYLMSNKDKSVSDIVDQLSFKGLMVREETVRKWYKKNGVKRGKYVYKEYNKIFHSSYKGEV